MDIPARGWKDISIAVIRNISDHRVLVMSAGSAFYFMLALSPMLAATVSLYGLATDASEIEHVSEGLSGFLPAAVIDIVRDQLQKLTAQSRTTLGLTFLGTFSVSLWSANRGTKAVIDALNIVYGERESRGLVRLNLVSLCLTASAIVLALFAGTATVLLPFALKLVDAGAETEAVLRFGRWPALLVAVSLALALVYYYAPDRDHPRWRWVTAGGAAASALWLTSSILFSWYTSNFSTYNWTYGSFGAIVALMAWLWLSAIVVLLGAEVDAEMEEHVGELDSNDADDVGLPRRSGPHQAH
jgi:membrane protein